MKGLCIYLNPGLKNLNVISSLTNIINMAVCGFRSIDKNAF